MKLDHVCIITSDAEGLMSWYKDKLGFERLHTWTVDTMPGLTLHYVGRDGFKIEIVGNVPGPEDAASSPMENIAPGYNHFAVSVGDLAATLEDLAKKDVPVAAPMMDVPQAGIKVAIILDLEGNFIELVEHIA
jgi:catechol 2,3-dioxygenase-like lactoylglutathione lyase family enzyme